jgi:hypothetical protein
MNSDQRRVITWACLAIALILFFFYFARPFWAWASWNESKNSLDLGFMKIGARPPFPSDARSVLVGLVLPVALAAVGRLTGGRKES